MPKALQNTWDDAVTRLKKEVYNPVSNIATGMVYHRFLHESSDPRRGWGEFEKQLTAVTERPGAINKLQSMLKEVQIAMSDSEIIQTLKGFRNKAQKDPDVVKDFIALRGYNGQQNGDK